MCMRIALTAIGLGFGSLAAAGPVVIEPDLFESGTNISSSFAGVTLCPVQSETTGLPKGTAVWAQISKPGYASTGSMIFANNFQKYNTGWGQARPNLCLVFDNFASFVSVDIIGDDPVDYGFIAAYRSDNTLIQRVETCLLGILDVQNIAVFSELENIKYVVLGGKGEDWILMDNIYANVVDMPVIPLPGGASMAAVGIGLILIRRRR